MVSSLIHDMASFVVGVANAQAMTLETDQEVVTRQLFAKAAGSFILDSFPGRRVKFNQELRPNDRIHFSAGIWRGTRVHLIQFVTGYDSYHFDSSMAKATMNFLAVNGSSLEPSVQNRFSLIDTNAGGYGNGLNSSYANLLNSTSSILQWNERRDLVDLIEMEEA